MSSFSQQHERRRRRRRSAASTVATTAATAAVAYGTYRLAQWYWKEDEECEEGTEHPLEEDLPSFFAEQQDSGTENKNRDEQKKSSNLSGKSNNTYSWLSTAAVGIASWVADSSSSNAVPQSGEEHGNNGHATKTSPRTISKLSRRQLLIRCRCQSRVAFQTCFQTLKPKIESLTDSSRQTKELKLSRRRRQVLEQRDQEEDDKIDKGVDTFSVTADKNQRERHLKILQEQEEELWREILLETTTRMMVTSYAYAFLLLSLTVQFHWLASKSDLRLSEKQQQQKSEVLLMRSHHYFTNEGVPLLVSTVRRSVEKVIFGDGEINEEEEAFQRSQIKNKNNLSTRWRNPSSQFVSSDDIEHILYRQLPRILDDVGMGSRQRRQRRRNWIRFVLPDEEDFDPLWDICRSPVWEDAQEQVLGYLWYRILRDGEGNDQNNINRGWGDVFRSNGTSNDTKSDDVGRKCNQHQQQPLAKVMAYFKKSASALFDDGVGCEDDDRASSLLFETAAKSTLGRLQMLPTVLELGDITFQ